MSYKPVPESRWRPARLPEARSGSRVGDGSLRELGSWRWRALLGLALVYVALALNVYFPWAALLIWWAMGDLRRGTTWFMEQVDRTTNPFVFWLLIGSWLALSVLSIALDLTALR